MKIILSRKSFDSGNGGIPSPILPSGQLIPFPIPSDTDHDKMSTLPFEDALLESLLRDLSKGRFSLETKVHYDPDLDRKACLKQTGWAPALGQRGAAESHLTAQGVGAGDVFLFFGWFRRVEHVSTGWRYVSNAPNVHILFGWMEIGDIIYLPTQRDEAALRLPWITSHPHFNSSSRYGQGKSTIYIASKTSTYSTRANYSAGLFGKVHSDLVLTKPGRTRSVWNLPRCFAPNETNRGLTYHHDSRRWSIGSSEHLVTLKSVAKGQEFVVDLDANEGLSWLRSLISTHS